MSVSVCFVNSAAIGKCISKRGFVLDLAYVLAAAENKGQTIKRTSKRTSGSCFRMLENLTGQTPRLSRWNIDSRSFSTLKDFPWMCNFAKDLDDNDTVLADMLSRYPDAVHTMHSADCLDDSNEDDESEGAGCKADDAYPVVRELDVLYDQKEESLKSLNMELDEKELRKIVIKDFLKSRFENLGRNRDGNRSMQDNYKLLFALMHLGLSAGDYGEIERFTIKTIASFMGVPAGHLEEIENAVSYYARLSNS